MTVTDEALSTIRTTEITQLLYRLYALMDDRDFDRVGELLTEDATGRTPGGLAEGRAALVAQARRGHASTPRLMHRVSNVLVDDEDDDHATVRAVIEAVFAEDDGEPVYRIGELYQARARRESGRWRIAGFTMRPVWQTGRRPSAVQVAAPTTDG